MRIFLESGESNRILVHDRVGFLHPTVLRDTSFV